MIATLEELVDRHRELGLWHRVRAAGCVERGLRQLHEELADALLAEAAALEGFAPPFSDSDVAGISRRAEGESHA